MTLDLLSRDMRGSLPPVPAEFLRAMNWGVVTLVVTGLTYHYFALVTVQQSALQHMHRNFYGFDPSYHVARYHFVHRVPHAWTPLHLARHRRRTARATIRGASTT